MKDEIFKKNEIWKILWENLRYIWTKKEKRESGAEVIFEEILDHNFPKMLTDQMPWVSQKW